MTRARQVMEKAQRVSPRGALGFAAVLMAIYVVGLLLFMENSTYETWGALFVGPVLVLVSLPILAREAARVGDRSLFWLLVAALIVKLGGAIVFQFVAFDVYDQVADTVGYHTWGAKLADQFRSGNFDTGYPTLTGIFFIRFIVAIVYTIIGTTKFGGFLFFSWLGFWGLFFFYRAFTIAVPEGRGRTYARYMFFVPSLAFWPSAIGKEAWMMLALGIAAYGAARLFTGKLWRGLLFASLGMWLSSFVRPHIAGIFAVAVAAGYLLRRPREGMRQLAPIAKVLSVAVVVVFAAVVAAAAERFLSDSGVDTDRGVAGVQSSITTRTSEGGSYFAPSLLQSPSQVPRAVLTVLYRPLPLEAHTSTAFVSSLENSFLLLMTLIRIPWAFAALKSVRRQPYVAVAIAYTAMFIVAFSSFANFGNLVRQRVQVLPLFLALLCIPPRRKEQSPVSGDASAQWETAS